MIQERKGRRKKQREKLGSYGNAGDNDEITKAMWTDSWTSSEI